MKNIHYWRNPTKAEINFGYGAIHYAMFPLEEVCHKNCTTPKKWVVIDGNRWYKL